MQYKIVAYRGKVNSVIDLKDSVIPVGSCYVGDDLFIIGLDPLEERHLSEEETVKEEHIGEPLHGD